MADSSTFIKFGLRAGAGYLAYKQGWLSFLGIGAPAASATPGTTSTGTPGAAVAQSAPAQTSPSLATLYQRIQSIAAANQAGGGSNCGSQPAIGMLMAGGVAIPNPADLQALATWQTCTAQASQTPMYDMDQWNALVVQAGGPNPMPDPVPVFPGVDRSTKMTAQTYWSAMSAALALKGLTGYMRRAA